MAPLVHACRNRFRVSKSAGLDWLAVRAPCVNDSSRTRHTQTGPFRSGSAWGRLRALGTSRSASIHHISRLRAGCHERAAAASRPHRLSARRLGSDEGLHRVHMDCSMSRSTPLRGAHTHPDASVSTAQAKPIRIQCCNCPCTILPTSWSPHFRSAIVRGVEGLSAARVNSTASASAWRLTHSASSDGRADAARGWQGWYRPILSIDR